jgi:hypothetical protein
MTRTTSDFVEAIREARLHPEPGYGGNIFPAVRIYSEIASRDEALAYQSALEKLLQSDDENIRKFAVTICLGFFTFYDAIPRPAFEDSRGGSR